MRARFAFAAVVLFAAFPSMAEPMNPDAARRFVVGKLFAFNCFDGSRGSGRIYGDGSVIGSVQFAGSGPVRDLWLPAGTIQVKSQAVCATVKGMLFEPCFNLDKTTSESFRGTVSGMNFAYCDFTRSSAAVASLNPRSRAPQPLPLNAPVRAQGK
jgi:hypothetical protein